MICMDFLGAVLNLPILFFDRNLGLSLTKIREPHNMIKDDDLLLATLDALKLIQKYAQEQHPELLWSSGICYNTWRELLFSASDVVTEETVDEEVWTYCILVPLFRTWPKFSGINAFPVPATQEKYYSLESGPSSQYMAEHNLWVGEYGKMRLDLLEHMITELAKKIISDS